MAQDPVERIVIISAHWVIKAASSIGLQIREHTPKPVTDYVCTRRTYLCFKPNTLGN
jgi:hypothetical protein